MRFFQVNERCDGCAACVANCPAAALEIRDDGDRRTLYHNMARCARCATCFRVCPQKAVEFQHLLDNDWAEVVTLELVRCEVCGEPVYTTRFLGKLDEKLTEVAVALCTRHRAERHGRAHAFPAAGKAGRSARVRGEAT